MNRLSTLGMTLIGLVLGLLSVGLPTAGAEASRPVPAKSGVKVFYFHGKFRCPTCLKIEKLSAQAVQDSFRDEQKRKVLEWQAVDVDAPENRHFDQEFALESSTLAVARYDGGKLRKYVKLERVWELVEGNEQTFLTYVREEIERFMAD